MLVLLTKRKQYNDMNTSIDIDENIDRYLGIAMVVIGFVYFLGSLYSFFVAENIGVGIFFGAGSLVIFGVSILFFRNSKPSTE